MLFSAYILYLFERYGLLFLEHDWVGHRNARLSNREGKNQLGSDDGEGALRQVEVYQTPTNHLVDFCLMPFMCFLDENIPLYLHVFFRTFTLLLHKNCSATYV